ncbi:MAG: hypothetical protein M0C28_41420 [Candidatus Moduliflexus flocculans]|nr:hypothetical protein [Candidatus Moduliflexus flocculans]
MNNVLPNITSALIDNNGNIILGGNINGPVVSSLGDTSQIIGGDTDFFIAKVSPHQQQLRMQAGRPQTPDGEPL